MRGVGTGRRPPDRPRTFASLRIRNYRLYFFGQGVSVAGNWMQNIAVAWLVLQLSHSGSVLGLMTAARFVPLVLLGPWGGLIADRLDTRRLLTATQTCSAALAASLAVLSWRGAVTLPVLLAVVLALGMVNVFDNPSRQSLISQLVDREHLGNAIALNSIAMNSSRVLGPGVGGALIAAWGITPCFFVNAVSFMGVIASLLAMRPAEMVDLEREPRAKGQIVAGFRYVRRTPAIVRPLLMVAVTGVLTWEFPVTLPLIISGTFHRDASAYGVAMACLGVGSVFGGLLAARRRILTVRSLAFSSGVWGVLIVLAALAPTLPVAFVALVFVGSGSVTFNSGAKTLLQIESAPAMRGRVMSLWSMAWQGSTVIGAPVVGAIGNFFGPRYALLTGGLAALAIGLLLFAPGERSTSRAAVPAVSGDPEAEGPIPARSHHAMEQ